MTLELNLPCCVTSCKVNNRVEGLRNYINDSRDLEYPKQSRPPSGLRTYTRSLFFVFAKAVRDLYPAGRTAHRHARVGGCFCRLSLPGGITPEVPPERLRCRMAEIVAMICLFRRVTAHTTDAIEVLRRAGLHAQGARSKASATSTHTTTPSARRWTTFTGTALAHRPTHGVRPRSRRRTARACPTPNIPTACAR